MHIPSYYEFCRKVKTVSGHDALERIPGLLHGMGAKTPMIVTDKGVTRAGLANIVIDAIEDLGEDAVGLMDTLGIEAAHFAGLSMGGIIGQYLALNHPERLLNLVLCDTLAVFPAEMHPIWEERIAVAREQGMQPFVQETMGRG